MAFCGYYLAFSKFLFGIAAFVCELERRDGASLAKRSRPVFGSKLDRPSLPHLACKSHLVLLSDRTSPCQTSHTFDRPILNINTATMCKHALLWVWSQLLHGKCNEVKNQVISNDLDLLNIRELQSTIYHGNGNDP